MAGERTGGGHVSSPIVAGALIRHREGWRSPRGRLCKPLRRCNYRAERSQRKVKSVCPRQHFRGRLRQTATHPFLVIQQLAGEGSRECLSPTGRGFSAGRSSRSVNLGRLCASRSRTPFWSISRRGRTRSSGGRCGDVQARRDRCGSGRPVGLRFRAPILHACPNRPPEPTPMRRPGGRSPGELSSDAMEGRDTGSGRLQPRAAKVVADQLRRRRA